ncbi:MAG: DUF6311 domain-containing protein [Faecalibacterium sp.]|jgi:hypothetical protein|nr:DUF6311 domain-containing protein [Faecalibacterium sp.]
MPQKLPAARRKTLLYLFSGALIGALVFFAVHTGAALDVTNDGWILTGYVEKDVLQHYTGWLFYRESPLGFPLGVAANMGSTVSYSDSIPLAAILFRLFAAWLPETFQYFGLWTLLCYILQGISAALLLSLFSESFPAVLGGTVLFCTSPILLERSFRHTALASHFLILFALYLYFSNRRQGFRFRAGYLVLLGLATAIHPYFVPMVFAILFADLAEQAVRTRRFARPLGFLAAGFAVVLGVGYAIGMFSAGSADLATGYGHFCMNLNSLFDPVSTGGIVWSNVLKQRPQALGSADGFNYLGLGVLAAAPPCGIIFLMKKRWRGALETLRRHWALALVSLCLTLFAVSTTILYGNLVVVRLTLPAALETLCSTFRSSGRMFYPVYYLIFLFVFSMLAQCRPAKAHWLPAALVTAVAVVQLWDMAPALAAKSSFFAEHRQDFTYPLQSAVWEEAGSHYTRVCSLDVSLYQAVYPAYFAASHEMSTDDAFTARYDTAQRQTANKETLARLESGNYDPDTLYITSDYDTFLALACTAGDAAYAVEADRFWYLLIPKKQGVTISADATSALYPALPLYLADYSDDDWTHGVSNANPSVAIFREDETTPRWADAESITADGKEYTVLAAKSRGDGYCEVTLDTPDAGVLRDTVLAVQLRGEA